MRPRRRSLFSKTFDLEKFLQGQNKIHIYDVFPYIHDAMVLTQSHITFSSRSQEHVNQKKRIQSNLKKVVCFQQALASRRFSYMQGVSAVIQIKTSLLGLVTCDHKSLNEL